MTWTLTLYEGNPQDNSFSHWGTF